MDSHKPPQKPTHLLDDLESIRDLLGDDQLEPPLLTDSIDPETIPLLSDIVTPPPVVAPKPARPATPATAPLSAPAVSATVQRHLAAHGGAELQRLDAELRAAAQLLLQDVIDDFVPQIEAELKRRLEARLHRLLPPRKS